MLTATKDNAQQYDYLAEKFKIGYAFLQRQDLSELPVGRIDLEQGVFVSIQEYDSRPEDEGKFETHDKYFDIQYIISGCELCRVAPRDRLNVKFEYEPERDITIYFDPDESNTLILEAGDLVVLPPEDAHKPCMRIGGVPCPVKKAVVKVPV